MKPQNIQRLIKACWIRACRFDQISIDAKFVIFSDDNPHLARYNKYIRMYQCGIRVMSNDGFNKNPMRAGIVA